MASKEEDKINLYKSYQSMKDTQAGKDLFNFIQEQKENAVELATASDNADARGRYQFIKSLEKHLLVIEKDAESAQKILIRR